jgi:hypothetical protein
MTETGFDLHGFYAEMWDVELMPSVNALKGLGLSAAVFYEGANLSEQWESGERDTQTSSLVTAIQFTNMLDDAEYDDAGVASLHGTMRTKALGLALACDSVHGTTYLADLATDPLQFGVHSMEDA